MLLMLRQACPACASAAGTGEPVKHGFVSCRGRLAVSGELLTLHA